MSFALDSSTYKLTGECGNEEYGDECIAHHCNVSHEYADEDGYIDASATFSGEPLRFGADHAKGNVYHGQKQENQGYNNIRVVLHGYPFIRIFQACQLLTAEN